MFFFAQAGLIGAGDGELAIDPQRWKITLPIPNAKGEALEVTNPEFSTYLADPGAIPEEHRRFFRREGEAFVFFCATGGATTKNSDYPRTELREMWGDTGDDEFEWTLEEGGVLEARVKIGPLVGGADKLVFLQIHGHEPEDRPLLKCLWEKGHLRLLTKSGEKLKDHQEKQRYVAIAEGRWFTCRIEAGAEEVTVAIDGEVVERFGREHLKFWPEGNTFYFKAGNYLQEKGEGMAATVSLSAVSVRHGDSED